MRYLALLWAVVLVFAGSARAQLNPGSPLMLGSPAAAFAAEPGLGASSAPAEPPQEVHGVFPSYPAQMYAGVTYMRFYEVPNLTTSMTGFDFSMAYYLRNR